MPLNILDSEKYKRKFQRINKKAKDLLKNIINI